MSVRDVVYASPPVVCDLCPRPIKEEFIDGKTIFGTWANMCTNCWEKYGIGELGLGKGQKYRKMPDKVFHKVDG